MKFQVISIAAAVKLSLVDSGQDGAAWFAGMGTIGKAASLSQSFDVVESLPDTIFVSPQLNLSHPRRIDHDSAFGQNNQFTVCRGMATMTIMLTHGFGFKTFFT